MPWLSAIVPLGMDLRDPVLIGGDRAQLLRHVVGSNQRLEAFGGCRRLSSGVIAGTPRDFFSGVYGTSTYRTLALAQNLLDVWDGTNWSGNLSGDSGRPAMFAQRGSGHYSVANAFNKAYIAGGTSGTILVYDPNLGAPNDLVTLAHDSPSMTTFNARFILCFNSHLFAIHTYEDGVEYPTRVRYSGNGLPLQWDENLTATDVIEVIETSTEPLTGAVVLGERCFLFKPREVIEIVATGDPERPFLFEPRITGIGCPQPFTLAASERLAFWFSGTDFYAFDGATLQSIGEPIRDEAELELYFWRYDSPLLRGFCLPAWHQYWVTDIHTSTTGIVWVYDYRYDRWSRLEFGTFDADGVVEAASGPAAIGTIINPLYPTSIGPVFETAVLTGPSGNRTQPFVVQDIGTSLRSDYLGTDSDQTPPKTVRTRTVWPAVETSAELTGLEGTSALYEVALQGRANQQITVTAIADRRPGITNGTSLSQTIMCDGAGRGKAYFHLTFTTLEFLIESAEDAFELAGILRYRAEPGGYSLPADPL